jgi:Ca-activated chloride channel homolog
MTDLHWGGPLWILLFLIPSALWFVQRFYSRRAILLQMDLKKSIRWHLGRFFLLFLCILCALVAVARPQMGKEVQSIKREYRDIVVLLDVSKSMLAEDISPSRIERAHRELEDLTELIEGDRVALVLFAGGAFARMPLTTDYKVFRSLVKDSTPDMLRAQGSDIGSAIEKGLELFDSENTSSRALLILSDGEEHSPRVESLAQLAADQGVRIFTMGIGTIEGAPIPNSNQQGGFLTDNKGSVVLTKLNSSALKSASSVSSGAYIQSTAGIDDMRKLVYSGIHATLDSEKGDDKDVEIWNEYYQWPLGFAVFCLFLSFLRRPNAGLVMGVLLVFSFPVNASTPELLAQHIQNPRDLGLAERAAVALLQDGQGEEAYRLLDDIARLTTDKDQRIRARYNSGLAAYQKGALYDAVSNWEAVLAEAPQHEAAQKNAEAVRQEIEQRLQQAEEQEQDSSSEQDSSEPNEGEESEQEEQESQNEDGESESSQEQEQNSESENNESTEEQEPTEGSTQDPSEEQQGEMAQNESEELNPEDMSLEDLEKMGSSAEPTDMSELQDSSIDMELNEAERTIDSVEEGRPNVVVGRRTKDGKQW